eukprot:2604825-Pyramimonas_sp.AAC.1
MFPTRRGATAASSDGGRRKNLGGDKEKLHHPIQFLAWTTASWPWRVATQRRLDLGHSGQRLVLHRSSS